MLDVSTSGHTKYLVLLSSWRHLKHKLKKRIHLLVSQREKGKKIALKKSYDCPGIRYFPVRAPL